MVQPMLSFQDTGYPKEFVTMTHFVFVKFNYRYNMLLLFTLFMISNGLLNQNK